MYNNLFISANGKFFGGVTSIGDDEVSIDIFNSDELKKMANMNLPGSIGGERFAISDDGELVSSAVYNDYGKGMIVVYSINNRMKICEIKSFNRVDWISFYEKTILMIGQKEKTYYYDLTTSETTEDKAYRVVKSYNIDIVLKKRNLIVLGDKKIKSRTFAFFKPIGVSDGIVLSEKGGNVIKFSLDGEKVWEIDISKWGHAIKLYYVNANNIIILDVFDYNEGDSFFVVVDNETGEILQKNSIKSDGYLVLPNGTISIIDVDGCVYRLDDNYERKYFMKL